MNETKKFYQKQWFMWLMLFIFAPIGLFLLWKYSDYSNKKKLIITAIFAFIFIIGVSGSNKNQSNTATKPVTQQQEITKTVEDTQKSLDKEKQAFSTWYDNLTNDLKKVDEDWKLWGATLNALSSGQIDRYKAFNNFKALSSAMKEHQSKLSRYPIPSELSKEHQDAIKKSMENLSLWAYYRHDACDDMKDLLDNNSFKPSEIDKIKEKIDSGDKVMFGGLAGIIDIQHKLGLLDEKSQ